jgi:hypothetical protein
MVLAMGRCEESTHQVMSFLEAARSQLVTLSSQMKTRIREMEATRRLTMMMVTKGSIAKHIT